MSALTPEERRKQIIQEQETIVKNAWQNYERQRAGTEAEIRQKETLGQRYVREIKKLAEFKVGIGLPD
jgi:hypothetical protein